jgi:5'-3' exonuclease
MSKKSVKFTLMPNPHQLILLDGSAFLFRAYFSTIAQNRENFLLSSVQMAQGKARLSKFCWV